MVLQILFLGPSNLLEPNASFAQMSQKLIVSPIVKTLVFSKVPEKVASLTIFYAIFFADFLHLLKSFGLVFWFTSKLVRWPNMVCLSEITS